MRHVRHHPDPLTHGSTGRARFNMLLTEDRWHGPDHWSRQLPRLMEPMGVASYKVSCGEEAVELAKQVPIHAAVIDLATPRIVRTSQPVMDEPNENLQDEESSDSSASQVPGGLWLLELFRRMPNHPPVVIVRSRSITARDVNRLLHDALRLGAFTVMENPGLEQLLVVFRRMLDRLYRGQWPEL